MIRAVFVLMVFALTAYCFHFVTIGSGLSDDSEFAVFFLLGLMAGMLTTLARLSKP